MATITYREATRDDVETLARLRYEMENERAPEGEKQDWAEFLAASRAALLPQMEAGRLNAWLAEADGMPVSGAVLIWWQMPPSQKGLHRRRGFVTSVYTLPDYRRLGIARRLMEMLIAFAREQNIVRLVLWASEMGEPLYRDLGFTPSRAFELNL